MKKTFICFALIALTLSLITTSVFAKGPKKTATVDVIFGGLVLPTGIEFGPDDNLYVLSSGSGNISRITDGSLTVVVQGLPVTVVEVEGREEVVGASNFVFVPEESEFPEGIYITVTGGPAIPTPGGPISALIAMTGNPLWGKLLFVSAEELESPLPVTVTYPDNVFVDISTWEYTSGNAATFPGEFPEGGPDSNPYEITYDSYRDVIYVADSGADEVIRITPEGEISSVYAFPYLQYEAHAVPNGLAITPDGDNLLVTKMGPCDFDPTTTSPILKIPLDGGPVRNFTRTTTYNWPKDLAFDSNGDLYMMQFADAWVGEAPFGAISFVNPKWTVKIVGFPYPIISPTEMVFGPDGALYVTSIFMGLIFKVTIKA